MPLTATPVRSDETITTKQSQAATGLTLVRLIIGAMFVSVFFENLGKGLYRPAGYAGLINYYITHDHAPAAWKTVMGFAASHASMAAPMQGVTEISLGILLVLEAKATYPWTEFVAVGTVRSSPLIRGKRQQYQR